MQSYIASQLGKASAASGGSVAGLLAQVQPEKIKSALQGLLSEKGVRV